MQHIQPVSMILFLLTGLFLSAGPKANAERLYRWKDQNGASCYSNVAPPAGVNSYSVVGALSPNAYRVASNISPADPVATGKIKSAADSSIGDSRLVLLEQRIKSREASICHIETLLRTHPKDSVLRKSLYTKNQYLHEDLTRLKLLQH